MIIVPIKEGENIEKALKKFKRKFEKTGVVRELRSRKQFEKPSVKRRNEIKKAIYVQHLEGYRNFPTSLFFCFSGSLVIFSNIRRFWHDSDVKSEHRQNLA